MGVYRVKSLDDDRRIKYVVEFFERNSAVKGSVGDAMIYVAPLYYFNPTQESAEILVASLVIERDASGYTVRINYWMTVKSGAESHEEVEYETVLSVGDAMELLEKAMSIKHPSTPKIAMLIGCLKGTDLINFLSGIYGDELLSDEETISGIYSVCSGDAKYFINDKVVFIPDIYIRIVRDTRKNKIYMYDNIESRFYEVPHNEKIFLKTLFERYRDLLEPETVIKRPLGTYSLSFSETVVDEKKAVIMMIQEHDPNSGKWTIYDILITMCGVSDGDECAVYSLRWKGISDTRTIDSFASIDLEKPILGHTLWSRRIQKDTKHKMLEWSIRNHTWEILPA